MTPDNSPDGQTPTLGDTPSLDNTPPTPAENMPNPTAALDAPVGETPPAPETTSSIEIKDPTADILNSLNKEAADPMANTVDPTTKPAEQSAEPAKRPGGKKKIILIVVIAVIAIILVVCGVIFLPKLFNNGGNVAVYDDEVFFIEEKNSSNSYAIFNADGEKLTDFKYANVSEFNGGFAAACLVEDNSKCGVINAKGEEVIEFGKYDTVEGVGGGYLVSKNAKRSVVTYENRTLFKLSEDNKDDINQYVYAPNAPYIIQALGDEQYQIYNTKGEEVKKIASAERPSIFYDGSLDKTFLSTKGVMYILKNDGTGIESENALDRVYDSVIEVSENKNLAILAKSTDADRKKYAIYFNGKVADISDNECSGINIAEDYSGQQMDYLTCGTKSSTTIIGTDGILHENFAATSHQNTVDYIGIKNNYNEEKTTTLFFFRNDSEIKRVELEGHWGIGSKVIKGYYSLVQDYGKTGAYKIFDIDGNLKFEYQAELPSTSISLAGPDRNGYYYLKDCETIDNPTYNSCYDSARYSIIDSDGNILFRADGDNSIEFFGGNYITYSSEDRNYFLYDKNFERVAVTNAVNSLFRDSNFLRYSNGFSFIPATHWEKLGGELNGVIVDQNGNTILSITGASQPTVIVAKSYYRIKDNSKNYYFKKSDNSIFYQN